MYSVSFNVNLSKQILLVYDQAEVRKIVRAAHWVMDRLALVEGVTSMRSLVVNFKVITSTSSYKSAIMMRN